MQLACAHCGQVLDDRGTILCGFNGRRLQRIPAATMKTYKQPPPTLPRSPGNVALRMRQRLVWDWANLKVANLPAAEQSISPKRRHGWAL
jgi:hypothetical protein